MRLRWANENRAGILNFFLKRTLGAYFEPRKAQVVRPIRFRAQAAEMRGSEGKKQGGAAKAGKRKKSKEA